MSTIYTCNGQILVDVSDNKWLAEPNVVYHSITYSTVSHGTVSGQATARAGDTVTVTATADTGYMLDYITVNGVAIVGNTFTMPDSNVTISAVFVQSEVTIGTQTWKTSNMAIDDGQSGIITVDGNVYYTQEAAIRVAATVNGWHLPTEEEAQTLISNTGSNTGNLASTSGWNDTQGTDTYGFNAQPLGQYDGQSQQLVNVGYRSYFWTPNARTEGAYGMYYKFGFGVYFANNTWKTSSSADVEYSGEIYGTYFSNSPQYLPVRLIKDSQ